MALVTVQRSPSPSNHGELEEELDTTDALNEDEEEDIELRTPPHSRSRSLSESYLAVKGAALILPQSECPRRITRGSPGGDIKHHLQSMFYLIRPQDTIKLAVKLESQHSHTRYLVIVSCLGRQDTEECTILGVDVNGETTIGLVLPIWADMAIRLDGDGGFVVSSQDRSLVFKPVSVQAMWSALQCLHKVSEIGRAHYYFPGGLTHTWLGFYQSKLKSSRECINEWEAMDDLMVIRSEAVMTSDTASLEIKIRTKLKEIMMQVDLEEVTTRYLRTEVEKALGLDLKEYRSFIDQETMTILGQLDKPSLVLDHLYLGSEWNASNLDELQENGVGFILNVTREIDNFFPGIFEYMNIRVWDNNQSDLLKYWEKTYKFIKRAQAAGSKCLVHCKMGISRSSSTVIAYLMKEFNWSADKATEFTSDIRSCINPNEAFRSQLRTYEGILDASNQRHNELFKPEFDLDPIIAPPHRMCSSPIPEDCRDTQGTLKEIAEEILASKYGKPPPDPFIFDEVDISSRSMDSIDECFPEIPTSLSSDCDNIRLVYYRRLSDQIAEPLMAASILLDTRDHTSSSSDSSELAVAFYNCLRAHSAKSGLYHRGYSPIMAGRNGSNEQGFDGGSRTLFTYDREQIPWNKGTVENTRQDYENRIKGRSRMGSHSSANSSSDEEGRIEIKGIVKEMVPVLELAKGCELTTETDTDDVCIGKLLRSPKPTHRVFQGRLSPVPGKSEPTQDQQQPQQDSSHPQDQQKPPHPSSSPIVTRRKKAKSASTRLSDSTDESFEVFHIGDEEVVVKKGKVRRHTMDFEQLKTEPEAKSEEVKENPEEEESEIPPKGVVRVQKEAFEKTSTSSTSGLQVSPLSTSPKQKDFMHRPISPSPTQVTAPSLPSSIPPASTPTAASITASASSASASSASTPAAAAAGEKIQHPETITEQTEECELPSAGIVEFHRRSYEEREMQPGDVKRLKKCQPKKSDPDLKVYIVPTSRRPSKLDCTEPVRPISPAPLSAEPQEFKTECNIDLTKEDLESGQVVQVRSLVHKFEQQSPSEESKPFPDDNQYSASAPSSPSKLSRKKMHRPYSSRMGSGTIPSPTSEDPPEQQQPRQTQPHAPMVVTTERRVRKAHGRTHPLERLTPTPTDQLSRNPFYKTM